MPDKRLGRSDDWTGDAEGPPPPPVLRSVDPLDPVGRVPTCDDQAAAERDDKPHGARPAALRPKRRR